MKPSAVLALVAAGVVAGAGVATYELTKPSDEPVRVNFVEPAATTTPTTEPTTTSAPKPSPTATTTTSSTTAAVTSSSTTHKATVRKEATVANTPALSASTTTNDPANGPVLPTDALDPSGSDQGTNIGVPTTTPKP